MLKCLIFNGFTTSSFWTFYSTGASTSASVSDPVGSEIGEIVGATLLSLLFVAGVVFVFLPLILMAVITYRVGRTNRLLECLVNRSAAGLPPAAGSPPAADPIDSTDVPSFRSLS
jgi:hypothetical protein